MKHSKKILSILLAAVLAVGIFIPASGYMTGSSGPGSNTQIIGIGGDTGIFEIFNGQEWIALTVPFWLDAIGGNPAFCLESNRDQPQGDGYRISNALYSENVMRGVRAILVRGFPNDYRGLEMNMAWYVTQVAIWTYMYETIGVGHAFYAQERLRPSAGNQAAWDFYLRLMDFARRGVDTVHYSARYAPHPVFLTPNGQGQLVGTGTFDMMDYLDSYSIDQSKLPAGVTITGNTYRFGDTFTVTAPMSYAGQTHIFMDCFRFQSAITPANIFWYEPVAGDLQNMVVYNMEFRHTHSVGITFTSDEIRQGRIVIRKNNANPSMGDYSLAGAVFLIYTGERVFIEAVTTDASGVARSRMLDHGRYIVEEVTAPHGFVRHDVSYGIALSGDEEGLNIPQQPQVGVIRVHKTNANPGNGDYSLAGAVFEIRTAGGNLVDTITTDAQGRANSRQLPLGEYRVTERTAPPGFIRDTNVYTANLVYGNQDVAIVYADVDIPQQPQQGRIDIRKTNVNPALGDYSLSGAIFDILDADGNVIDTVTTNVQGEAQSRLLRLGSYTVRERTAPYGFVLILILN